MIVYFSGTGNSRFAAEFLAKQLNDELLNAGQRMKAGEDSRTGNAAGICWSGKRCSPYRKYQPD